MKPYVLSGFLWLFASPILILRALVRAYRKSRVYEYMNAESIPCACGADVPLIGLWRCGCGFTYRGQLLRPCPICQTIPRVVRCHSCRVTILLPEA